MLDETSITCHAILPVPKATDSRAAVAILSCLAQGSTEGTVPLQNVSALLPIA